MIKKLSGTSALHPDNDSSNFPSSLAAYYWRVRQKFQKTGGGGEQHQIIVSQIITTTQITSEWMNNLDLSVQAFRRI